MSSGQPKSGEPSTRRKPESPDPSLPPPEDVDHSMKEEEPLGWDQAPVGEDQQHPHRHPRTEGKGGVPDATDRKEVQENPAASTTDQEEARKAREG